MMVFVLILAVFLGWRVNRARQQARAVAAVQKNGGWVHYDYEFVGGNLTKGAEPWAPRVLRSMLGDEIFQEIEQVSLVYDDSSGTRYDNKDFTTHDDLLAQLTSQSGIKTLLLHGTQATDEGLKHIGKMTSIEALYFWDATSITDAGVAHLAGLKNLKRIHISRSQITDKSLVLLSRLPMIEELSLQEGHFSDNGFLRLKGQNTLEQLATGRGSFEVTDAGLIHLKEFKNLTLVDLQNSKVTAGARPLEGNAELENVMALRHDDHRKGARTLPRCHAWRLRDQVGSALRTRLRKGSSIPGLRPSAAAFFRNGFGFSSIRLIDCR